MNCVFAFADIRKTSVCHVGQALMVLLTRSRTMDRGETHKWKWT